MGRYGDNIGAVVSFVVYVVLRGVERDLRDDVVSAAVPGVLAAARDAVRDLVARDVV